MGFPNLFLVGAPRCGTTAMYDYLKSHPQITMSSYKEPHYFGSDLVGLQFEIFRNKEAKYLQLFLGNNAAYFGEASVYYLFSSRAAAEIHAFNPDARILIMLRSPFEVLNSLFHQAKLTGDIAYKDYMALIEDAENILADRNSNSRLLFFLGAGVMYSQQVQRYYDRFGREQVHVVLYDDFKENTAKVYRDVLEFLGVDADFQPESFSVINPARQVANPILHALTSNKTLIKIGMKIPLISLPIYRALKVLNSKPLDRPEIPEAVKARLRPQLTADVEALGRLIDRDLSMWLANE